MNILNFDFKCTGCRLCEQVCPQKCIVFLEDKEGFLSPQIDCDACVDCGLCAKACPQLNDVVLNEPIETYASYILDDSELGKSTSGGAFYQIARKMINEGGVVFGCAWNDTLKAQHCLASTLVELSSMRGSKYVQSDTLHTYVEAANALKNNTPVLYTGTPCQIAGLKSYLKTKRISGELLLTVDLVCHGVPSPGLFRRYLEWFEMKNRCHVISYDFRNKEKVGWNNGYFAKVQTNNKIIKFASHKDPYFYSFLRGKTYRECCYECKYSTIQRVADITIADYWGVDKIHPEHFNKNGVSLILINTSKGKSYFKKVEGLKSIESYVDQAKLYNHNLNSPVSRPAVRNDIYVGLYEWSLHDYFKKKHKIELSCREKLIVSCPTSILLLIRKIKKIFK